MKTVFTFLTLIIAAHNYAQIGGTTSFPLLDLTFNARSAGLGGNFISAKDKDINLGVANPSLLNGGMHNQISVNQAFHAGKVNYGMISYGRALKKNRFIAGHIRYVNYGKIQGREVNGVETATFNPFEYVFGVGFGQQLNPRISVGGNVNIIGSHLETYTSYGASLDLAGTFTTRDSSLLVTAIVKNAGVQFNSYNDKRNLLPINFQAAVSYKVKHAPFRFSVLMHHLNKWDITYNDPNLVATKDPLTGELVEPKRPGFGEKLAQHLAFQLEILASKNFHLRAGFDYYGRQSLKVDSRPGAAGLSFGTGLYFKRFSFDYGFTIFSRSGFNHMITLSTNISKVRS